MKHFHEYFNQTFVNYLKATTTVLMTTSKLFFHKITKRIYEFYFTKCYRKNFFSFGNRLILLIESDLVNEKEKAKKTFDDF